MTSSSWSLAPLLSHRSVISDVCKCGTRIILVVHYSIFIIHPRFSSALGQHPNASCPPISPSPRFCFRFPCPALPEAAPGQPLSFSCSWRSFPAPGAPFLLLEPLSSPGTLFLLLLPLPAPVVCALGAVSTPGTSPASSRQDPAGKVPGKGQGETVLSRHHPRLSSIPLPCRV